MIKVTLPDGSIREYEKPVKALQIAQVTKDIENKLLTSLLAQSRLIVDNNFDSSILNLQKEIDDLKGSLDRDRIMRSILQESLITIKSINF